MTEAPAWLPGLIYLRHYGGKWDEYVEAMYAVFRRDFIESQPQFQGRRVLCRRDPLYDGKEAAFWHCIQEGAEEEQRTPTRGAVNESAGRVLSSSTTMTRRSRRGRSGREGITGRTYGMTRNTLWRLATDGQRGS